MYQYLHLQKEQNIDILYETEIKNQLRIIKLVNITTLKQKRIH